VRVSYTWPCPTTGDKQQLVGNIGGHAHGHAAIGGVDEQLGGAALDITTEDVPRNRSPA
jgi:hypothetical protein